MMYGPGRRMVDSKVLELNLKEKSLDFIYGSDIPHNPRLRTQPFPAACNPFLTCGQWKLW